MCVSGGINVPGPMSFKDQSGFRVGQRVEITQTDFFQGWYGSILGFGVGDKKGRVAINLNEPPPGHQKNGQWFDLNQIKDAPRT